MRYNPIESSFFSGNRKRLSSLMPAGSLAIFNANDEMPRNGDLFFDFRQNSDLFYLTGLDQEKIILVLFPDHPDESMREIVFSQKTNQALALWHGHKYTQEEVTAISGITRTYWLEEFVQLISQLIPQAGQIFYNKNENARFASEVPSRDARLLKELQQHYPDKKFTSLAPSMKELRMIKQKTEIDLIRQACAITRDAFIRVLRCLKPGLMEYEIEAEITHEFIRQGANGHAYHPIIAAGKNALCLHYGENNTRLQDGDLVLLDFGAEYANYASDLSRTLPVNGRFTDRQKDCYNAVLRVLKQARAKLRAGNTIDAYHKEVCALMEEEMIGLKLFTRDDIKKQEPGKPLFHSYFMHGTSHFMGLDTHDLGDKDIPLRAGMVFSCEPGLYIQQEGLGIRIENDILITDHGPVDLLEDVPLEVEEIEDLMNR